MTKEQIKDIRKLLSLSQEQFAQLIAVTAKTVARWESGESKPTGPALQNLQKLNTVISDKEGKKELLKVLALGTGIALGSVLINSLSGLIGLAKSSFGPEIMKSLDSFINKKK